MISASYSDISVRMLSIYGCQKSKPPFGSVFIFVKANPTGSVRSPRHIYVPRVNEVYVIGDAHDQYADEQLANLQKRICLIEFLHLGLVIGCQGAMLALPKIKNTRLGVFLIRFPTLSSVRKLNVENRHRFTHLRTFYKKRLEI